MRLGVTSKEKLTELILRCMDHTLDSERYGRWSSSVMITYPSAGAITAVPVRVVVSARSPKGQKVALVALFANIITLE
jgi:hypothetical protein